MYRKKGRDTLTGGTKDINPQYMHLTASQSAADTSTTTSFPIPIQRLQAAGRAQVLEVLKVLWDVPQSSEADSALNVFLTTSSFGTSAISYGNTRVIDSMQSRSFITTSGTIRDERPVIHDLTDGAGHGFLVATDNVFIQVNSTTTGATNIVNCKILYRWKDVSVVEYVGIVQGQQ